MSSGAGTQNRHCARSCYKIKPDHGVTLAPEGSFRSNTSEMQNRIRSKHQNSATKQNKPKQVLGWATLKLPCKQQSKHSQDPFLMVQFECTWAYWVYTYMKKSVPPAGPAHTARSKKQTVWKSSWAGWVLKAETQLARDSFLKSSEWGVAITFSKSDPQPLEGWLCYCYVVIKKDLLIVKYVLWPLLLTSTSANIKLALCIWNC